MDSVPALTWSFSPSGSSRTTPLTPACWPSFTPGLPLVSTKIRSPDGVRIQKPSLLTLVIVTPMRSMRLPTRFLSLALATSLTSVNGCAVAPAVSSLSTCRRRFAPDCVATMSLATITGCFSISALIFWSLNRPCAILAIGIFSTVPVARIDGEEVGPEHPVDLALDSDRLAEELLWMCLELVEVDLCRAAGCRRTSRWRLRGRLLWRGLLRRRGRHQHRDQQHDAGEQLLQEMSSHKLPPFHFLWTSMSIRGSRPASARVTGSFGSARATQVPGDRVAQKRERV